jgi:hypothetical protein
MRLRHATIVRNLPSIIKAGLLTSKSQGKLPAVWLHSPSCSAWAGWHTIRRHGGRIENVVIVEIDVPRGWLRRSKKGLWYSRFDIPPDRIRGVVTFAALARSPVEEAAAS